MALKAFRLARSLGCRVMHIGGGEPFLRFEELLKCCEAAQEAGVAVEYVETNSSWFKSMDEAVEMLKELKRRAVSTLLVSISPFHNEYIPFSRVQGVMEACRRAGISIFPWSSDFIQDLGMLDPSRPHKMKEYQELFGRDYLYSIPSRYWIVMRGRALDTFAGMLPEAATEQIVSNASGGCRELLDTSHFHIDLYGRYLPGLCSGLGIRLDDLAKPLVPEEYPVIHALLSKGPGGLLEMAGDLGFKPAPMYRSKCHLCQEVRTHLIRHAPGRFHELSPPWFYEDHPG